MNECSKCHSRNVKTVSFGDIWIFLLHDLFFHPIKQTSIKPPWDYHLSAINPAFSFFLFFGVTSQQSFVITSIPEMVQFLSKVSKIRLNSGSLIFTSIWYLFSHSPILLKLLLFTLHTFLLKRKEDTVR